MIAVIPVDTVNTLAYRALQTAFGISRKVHVVHVKYENSPRDFASEWDRNLRGSIESAGLPQPELVVLESPIGKLFHRSWTTSGTWSAKTRPTQSPY